MLGRLCRAETALKDMQLSASMHASNGAFGLNTATLPLRLKICVPLTALCMRQIAD